MIVIDFSFHDQLNLGYGFYRYGVDLIRSLHRHESQLEFAVVGSRKEAPREISHVFNDEKARWRYFCFPRQRRRLGHFIDQWAYARLMKKIKPTLIHSLSNFIPFFANCPIVVTFHDLYEETLRNKGGGGGLYISFLKHAGIGRCSRIITSSKQTSADLSKYWKIKSRKLRTVHLGTNISRQFIPHEKRKSSLLIARYNLFPGKNMLGFLKALAILKSWDISPTVVLFGRADVSFENESIFKSMAGELGIKDQIIRTGFVPDEELLKLYDSATVFVLPSLVEGFGLPLIEAMSRGLAVVANNKGATAEVVGDSGVLVDAGDPHDFALGIASLLINTSLRRNFESLGFDRSALFTSQRMARETLAVYDEII